ncbi:Calexcitin-2 [Papilio machaon]|uniref:Calexcitin-2 n=1 Tax=Papilio machaon TaxID=76193 RepID=A0A0N1PFN0_PAPMA|nr:Calexcitin-2 [Papilio machaon]
MVSDFRRKKLMYMFKVLDKDGNGIIEKKDFEMSCCFGACRAHAAQQREMKQGDSTYDECFEIVWDALQKVGDSNSDGQVSAEEWVTMWDTVSKSAADRDWLDKYCKFIFKMQDLNGDGFIDSDDFVAANIKSGTSKEEAWAAFQKLSQGKPKISMTEFQKLWYDFFISDDPNAPGNFIIGRPSFD